MKDKILNPLAQQTVIQINNTLEVLQQKSLAISYNKIVELDYTQHACQITWKNHQMGRENTEKFFLKIEQYMYILRNNSYHCLLMDGSLIRVNFEFEDNVLLVQNLLWWPAPYNYGDLLSLGYSPVQLMEDFCVDSQWFKVLKMRSPIRVDFDSKKNTQYHPKSHMHIQHEESRLQIEQPICFNRFIDFIIRNFYPGFVLSLSPYDSIYYKTPTFEDIDYVSSEVII